MWSPFFDTMSLPSLIVIAGPTGVGKTRFALELAQAANAEIISVDSLQVYRGLDIGTAKASAEERAAVPHHLIDILSPDEDFNVADFMAQADKAVEDIVARGKNIIAAGGTNLYMRAFVHGLFDAPPPDDGIRARHKELANYYGVIWLYKELERVDPTLAARIHHQDLVRISRGLEVFEQTGTPLSRLQDAHKFQDPRFRAFKLALNRPRQSLYERINTRVDAMMQGGLMAEYDALIEGGFSPDLKPLMSLGYRHARFLREGTWSEPEMVSELQKDTRRFAKQQLSWLRSEPQIQWALAPELEDARIRARMLEDLCAFFEGEDPNLNWAQDQDPYKS